MAFGSNDFPIGPNGQYPKQRISDAGSMIAPPMNVEQMYRDVEVKLPSTEKEFTSACDRAKRRMAMGMSHNMRKLELKPRYAMDADYGLSGPSRAWRRFFGGLMRGR